MQIILNFKFIAKELLIIQIKMELLSLTFKLQ